MTYFLDFLKMWLLPLQLLLVDLLAVWLFVQLLKRWVLKTRLKQ